MGSFDDLKRQRPGAKILGNGKQLLMPGLVDAHSHGRGMSPIQKGVKNDFLENALFDWAYMQLLPPELCAGMAAYHHIRTGATLLHHNGFDDDGAVGASRAHAAIKVYLDSGIRLAFSPGVRDESKLALDEFAFFETLPADLKDWARPRVQYDKAADRGGLLRALRRPARQIQRRQDPNPAVAFVGARSHRALRAQGGRRRRGQDRRSTCIRCSRRCRRPTGCAATASRPCNGSTRSAWWRSNVTYGHAIHVTQADIDLMGRRGASVTNHPSCNFIMRNGITPVMQMRKAGINVAMGLDDKTINDDEDAVMELRMMHKVHRLASYELSEPPLDAYEALEIATLNGARVCGFEGETGALAPGMKADAVLVDLDRVENEPWLDPRSDIVEAFVQRAMGSDVDTVVIGGRVAMEQRRAEAARRGGAVRRGARVLRQGPERGAPQARRHARAHQAVCAEMVQWLARARW